MLQSNRLYYGDNLDILRRYIKDESVDLVSLDPPFNSPVRHCRTTSRRRKGDPAWQHIPLAGR